MNKINIGLTEEQRYGVMNLLNQDLADSYVLVVKTKKYHWDVVGPQFRTLHELWDEQYESLTENIDALAERIRKLGGYPTGTMEGFIKIATLKEYSGEIPTATGMVTRLLEDHEQVIRNLRSHVDRCSEEFHDQGSADFLTELMEEHEEMAWMLRSFIQGESLEPDRQEEAKTKIPVGV
ncbi:DNA starvation/stationary phase protection protein [Anabaena cylindrica FACHB-243]|uniref:Dps family protein n=1 Tax=Anabaena TaxID=1163 RepID=UPI000B60086A|nr:MULTISPECIES: Dps family protein [Anabaena]BAY05659.1 ferritin Dps family protein [Anabaena cylindrica PCC 7122]MBD2421032.1 DNA starvation/stationary phase protection protein [Anabaena cylindrica FACHB-243]MBY5280736.1 DNA starvation/stationary phase protection protein [Anabaena sp. CCAP 1446/1C]MBY5306397.1 DNA starvation/stationary phase protection protein [Anabaena sp. CCAP 1446/1C]MCM2405785.1 DNA starvation/stationary phase protection protein [Anabaena sp. CCAP 1446/1C]